MVYQTIYNKYLKRQPQLALLLDPDKYAVSSRALYSKALNHRAIDYIFVGGSLISCRIDTMLEMVRAITAKPIVLFSGSATHLSTNLDAVLFTSLISGRNPEYLIGQHVVAAPFLKQSNLEVIPTGYMLIESGKTSSVEYISASKPIPCDKPDIAVATAIAGEMLGHKLIYMDAGSGAPRHIPASLITEVKKNITVPLIIGGGIRTSVHLNTAFEAGADMVVLGTVFENSFDLFIQMIESVS